jgi:hypothetical protein
MGTQRVQMKGVLPWLVRWARRAGSRDFYPALAALVNLVKNIFFPHSTLLQFMCPHRPATWASSRTGPPVYEFEYPVKPPPPPPQLSAYLPAVSC